MIPNSHFIPDFGSNKAVIFRERMSSNMDGYQWLLVEWENRSGTRPKYGLVNKTALVNRNMELHTGKLVTVVNYLDLDKPPRRAKIVMISDDPRFLEEQLVSLTIIQENSQQIEPAASASPNALNHQVPPSPLNVQEHPQGVDQLVVSGPQPHNNELDQNSKKKTSRSDTTDSESDVPTLQIVRVNNHDRNKHIKKPVFKVNSKKSQANYSNHEILPQRNSYLSKKKSSHIRTPPPVFSTSICKMCKCQKQNNSVIKYEQGSQTGLRFDANKDDDLSKLEKQIAFLASYVEEMERKYSILKAKVNSLTMCDSDDSTEIKDNNMNMSVKQNVVNGSNEQNISPKMPEEEEKRHSYGDGSGSDGQDDMMPIGSGQTSVPKHLYSQVDWSSYTIATRKLLMALFPRRTLATHSLTGKSSPAFMNRPAKLCLDPVKVNDVVLAVTMNSKVREGLVRSAITTKCADEYKMFRMRQEKRKKNANGNANQENIPPRTYNEDKEN